jgi:flagellar biosynthetic protein FliQ
MEAHEAVSLAQQAIAMGLLIAAPLLVVGMIVGLGIGLLQALTQIQDQTVAFVPKLVAMIIAIFVAMPWLIQKMMDYSEVLITNIPRTLGGG